VPRLKSNSDCDISQAIREFLEDNPYAKVLDIARHIGREREATQKRLSQLFAAGHLKRMIRVLNPTFRHELFFTLAVDHTKVRSISNFVQLLSRDVESSEALRGTVRIVNCWQNMGGSVTETGDLGDGLTLYIRVRDQKVVMDLDIFLGNYRDVTNAHLISLMPVSDE
jgi:hypothetical protein